MSQLVTQWQCKKFVPGILDSGLFEIDEITVWFPKVVLKSCGEEIIGMRGELIGIEEGPGAEDTVFVDRISTKWKPNSI